MRQREGERVRERWFKNQETDPCLALGFDSSGLIYCAEIWALLWRQVTHEERARIQSPLDDGNRQIDPRTTPKGVE